MALKNQSASLLESQKENHFPQSFALHIFAKVDFALMRTCGLNNYFHQLYFYLRMIDAFNSFFPLTMNDDDMQVRNTL